MLIKKINKNKCNNVNLLKKINFSFHFISLISPFITNNVRFSFLKNENEKKILVKQSYIILTWFYYLNFLQKNLNNKNQLKFFSLPLKIKKFTLTKAPMAHKNWSKEQYKSQLFPIKISFNAILKEENNLNCLNTTLLFIILSKKSLPQFETNILFLKYINLYFSTNDKYFFNYNSFSRNK
jgi:hypothetical protein